MKKYEVVITTTDYRTIVIEADKAETAEQIAWDNIEFGSHLTVEPYEASTNVFVMGEME